MTTTSPAPSTSPPERSSRRAHRRRWLGACAVAGLTAIFTFATFHQVLVAVAPMVYVALPFGIVLTIPITLAFAAMRRTDPRPSGAGLGVVLFVGLTAHYALITVAMWDRTFDDGPRGGWQLLALGAAPIVVATICAVRYRSVSGTIWIFVASAVLAFMVSGFQESEPDPRNVGAWICLLPTCVAAGWILEKRAPQLAAVPASLSER